MKKIAITFCGALLLSQAHAQLSQGGLPLSYQHTVQMEPVSVPANALTNPDWNGQLEQEKRDGKNSSRPYIIGLLTPASISFPESGTLTTLEDGRKIWKAQIAIPGAPAIGLYCSNFFLPKGVKLFLTNGNQRQVLGAYTDANNAPQQVFATEPVQGSVVNIELDLDNGVNADDIKFLVNRAAVYHRGVEYLQQFVLIDGEGDAQTSNTSSVCMINAVCPQGENYQDQRKASAGIIQPVVLPDGQQGIGFCSGTMVNNTGNNAADCKPYFLTASHCDPFYGNDFSQSIFRFNYETTVCESTTPQVSRTLTGATLKARNVFSSDMITNTTLIKGDFMLLELTNTIPSSWDVHFAGWDINTPAAHVNAPQKFIGFHHPGGDYKKLSTSHDIFTFDLATGQSGSTGNHWGTLLEEGYVGEGSSGSGLFNGSGLLIGIASVAGQYGNDMPPNCNFNAGGDSADAFNFIAYSKLMYDWDFSLDGTTSATRLKPWLDPANSGVTTLNGTNSQCTTMDTTGSTDTSGNGTGVNYYSNDLSDAIGLYPNPTHDGLASLAINLKNQSNLNVEVIDITGKVLKTYDLKNVQSGKYHIDLSTYADGMYILKISNGRAVAVKKLLVAR